MPLPTRNEQVLLFNVPHLLFGYAHSRPPVRVLTPTALEDRPDNGREQRRFRPSPPAAYEIGMHIPCPALKWFIQDEYFKANHGP
jgi:hypothetical protein